MLEKNHLVTLDLYGSMASRFVEQNMRKNITSVVVNMSFWSIIPLILFNKVALSYRLTSELECFKKCGLKNNEQDSGNYNEYFLTTDAQYSLEIRIARNQSPLKKIYTHQ